MTLFIAVWIIYNVVVAETACSFDAVHNKFTLLTLLLSLQASYAAPLILLAQNRQADRDRVQYEQDRALTERAVADTEYLARELASMRVALGEVATRDFLRGELQRLLDELAPPRTRPLSPTSTWPSAGAPTYPGRTMTAPRRRPSRPSPLRLRRSRIPRFIGRSPTSGWSTT